MYDELLNKLMQYQDIHILETLSIEFYLKAIYDINYQGIYLDICHKLWTNLEWQDNLYSVVTPEDENNKFYWYLNDNRIETPSLNGPYKSENDLRDQVRKIVNLKRYFLNYLQKQFNQRHDLIEKSQLKNEEDEELRYKLRRHIFGPIEIMCKMYWKKYIPQSIIHIVILKLLCYQENNLSKEEEIESFCILWKIIDHGKNIPFKPVLINQYIKLLRDIQEKSSYSTRINFLIQDLLNNYREKYGGELLKRKIVKEEVVESFDSEKVLYKYLKKGGLEEASENLMKHNKQEIVEEVVDNIYYLVCENPNETDQLVKLWKVLENGQYFRSINYKKIKKTFLDNIADIEVDCPQAKVSIKKFSELIINSG